MIQALHPGPLQKKLMRKLAFLMLVLAAGAAVLTFMSEIDQVQEKIEKRALSTMKKRLDILVSSGMDDRILSESGFASLAIYGRDGELFYQKETPSAHAVLQELSHHDDTITDREGRGESVTYIKSRSDGHVYILLTLQTGLPSNISKVLALYDATRHGDVAVIYAEIFRSVLLAVALAVALVLFIYPTLFYLERNLIAKTQELNAANLDLLGVLGAAVALKDTDTNAHNYRVTLYAIAFARALGYDNENIRALIKGGFLHDVGKIGVPDDVLFKRGPLNPHERAAMNRHVAYGLQIVRNAHWLRDGADVIGSHHEWFDGSGYPEGLKADAISKNAQLFAIVDVFDALTSKRPYKEALSFDETADVMNAESGSHFNPQLLMRFFDTIRPLYDEIGGSEDETELKERLRRMASSYFTD